MSNENYRWGYAFLKSDSNLDSSARFDLMRQAIQMYLDHESNKIIEGENYGGTLKMKGYASLGSFGGVRFEGNFNTEKGKANLSFLISEQTYAGFGDLERDASLLN
ncbi:hypothetical protein J4437_00975 [Candidatus Woesearchaeota archaeon]|nr:hypothetical protein [Candidatus Woesearchaeota archaeon]